MEAKFTCAMLLSISACCPSTRSLLKSKKPSLLPLCSVQNKTNFPAIVVTDSYKECVSLWILFTDRLIENMKFLAWCIKDSLCPLLSSEIQNMNSNWSGNIMESLVIVEGSVFVCFLACLFFCFVLFGLYFSFFIWMQKLSPLLTGKS